MKKLYSCLLALTIALLSMVTLALPAAAEGGGGGYIPDDVVFYEENGFQYVLLEDDTAMVTAFPSDEVHMVIPDTLGGHIVTEIAGWEFYDNPAHIPADTVSISLPGSLRALGGEVFGYAYRLKEIVLRPGSTAFAVDENGVLFNKDKTELIYYPAGKTDTKYSVPEGTRKIAENAFLECLNLKELCLPASLETVYTWYFAYCHRLESISVSADNPFYSSVDGVLFNKAKTVLYTYPCQNPRTVYYIPNTVTELANGAFTFATQSNQDVHCTLTAVYVPNSVQVIGVSFVYATIMGTIGYPDPIETLTVYLENGSPLQAYCMENGIACAHWDGKVPTNPEEIPSTETDLTTPVSDKTGNSENNATNAADNSAVAIPNTAGSVKPVAAGATAMLAFSAVVVLCRKKEKIQK